MRSRLCREFLRIVDWYGACQRNSQARCAKQQQAADNFCDRVRLIQAEFVEMPGLHLSKRQAERLWNLDERSAKIVFDALEQSGFLKRTADDMYMRADVNY